MKKGGVTPLEIRDWQLHRKKLCQSTHLERKGGTTPLEGRDWQSIVSC